MTEFTPLPAQPTNADLAKAIAETHACLDEHRKHVMDRDVVFSAQIKGLTDLVAVNNAAAVRALSTAKTERNVLKAGHVKILQHLKTIDGILAEDALARVEIIKKQTDNAEKITSLSNAFGLSRDEKKRSPKPIALMSQFELAWKFALSIGGIAALYRIIIAVWPVIDHLARSGKI